MPGLNSYRQDRFCRIRTRKTSLFQAPRESVRSPFLFPLSRPVNFSRAFHFRDFPTIWEPGTGSRETKEGRACTSCAAKSASEHPLFEKYWVCWETAARSKLALTALKAVNEWKPTLCQFFFYTSFSVARLNHPNVLGKHGGICSNLFC